VQVGFSLKITLKVRLLSTSHRLPSSSMRQGGLKDELGTKIFYKDFSRFVGAVDGSGFAALVYEMPGMQF
jgi:hypothetical protein